MNELKIKLSNSYHTPHKYSQRILTFWIGLYVKGMKFSRLWLPNGKLIENYREDPGPYLFLRWAGMKTTFEYCAPRKNWVTMFSCEGLEVTNGGSNLVLNWNDHQFELPVNLPVSDSMLPVYRNRFQEMTQKYNSGLPKNIFCAELMLLNLLETMLNSSSSPNMASPVEKFKKLIDDDKKFEYNISEFSEMCGFSKDYLRLLFQQTYHISPKEYQNNKRMTMIVELITKTDISLKEIAFLAGLKNITHLNYLIKKKYDLTPGQLRTLQIS